MLIVEVITARALHFLGEGGRARVGREEMGALYLDWFFFIGFYTDNGALTGGHASSGVLFVKDGIILY